MIERNASNEINASIMFSKLYLTIWSIYFGDQIDLSPTDHRKHPLEVLWWPVWSNWSGPNWSDQIDHGSMISQNRTRPLWVHWWCFGCLSSGCKLSLPPGHHHDDKDDHDGDDDHDDDDGDDDDDDRD